MPEHASNHHTWTVVDTRQETCDTTTIFLEPQGAMPLYIPGQYLTVLLPHFEPVEGKSYSISSIPSDPHLSLTVKSIGNFSRSLCTLRLGDHITTSSPYGFFYPELGDDRPLIFIAGGIGIVPCMSIIRNELVHDITRDLILFYSNKTREESVFLETLTFLETNHPHFKTLHHLTREQVPLAGCINGRISGAQIQDKISNYTDADFFVCGSIGFTKGLWQELRTIGVESNHIYTEGFF